MNLGLDTNVLIYAQFPVLPGHEVVRAYLLRQLARDDITLVITPSVLHEFIHVVTDSRRFEPPLSMNEAVATAHFYLGRPNISCLTTDEACLKLALDLIEHYKLGRKRLADTLFAATLLQHQVTRLITCNVRDFRVFEGLEPIDPRKEDIDIL